MDGREKIIIIVEKIAFFHSDIVVKIFFCVNEKLKLLSVCFFCFLLFSFVDLSWRQLQICFNWALSAAAIDCDVYTTGHSRPSDISLFAAQNTAMTAASSPM